MSLFDALQHRLRVLGDRKRYAREVDEELRFHMSLEAMQQAHAGATDDDARHAARRKFGNPTLVSEQVRHIDGVEMLDTMARELKYAGRTLGRSPGFTTVALLTLALGIGATTAVFAVVNGVLLRPLPFSESDRLVGVWHTALGIGITEFEHSDGTYLLYRDGNHVFESFGVYDRGASSVVLSDRPERVASTQITDEVLHVLRATPLRGRLFNAEDTRPGASPVALMSEGIWRREFGADPSVVGRSIQVNGIATEVVGILPSRFAFPDGETVLWLPLKVDAAHPQAWSFNYDGVARLRPGVRNADAVRDLEPLLATMPDRFPGFLNREGFEGLKAKVIIRPLRDDVVGDVGTILWIVLGTAAFVLIIGCANVANLFLVRAEARQKEMAVRAALGAGRGELIRHALGESLALAVGGGLLGGALAYLGVRALIAIGPTSLPRLNEISIDWRVLLFVLFASLGAGVLFSVLPVARYARTSLGALLKDGARGSTSGRDRQRARHALVVVQVALALVLLAGSALLMRSLIRLRSVDPGFEPSGVLTFRVSLPDARYPGDTARARFYSEVLRRMRTVPGVREAGLASKLPLLPDGHNNSGTWFEDHPLAPGGLPPIVEQARVADGYFRAMGIPMIEGRDFDAADRERGSANAVVSKALAEHFWPHQSVLGKRFAPTPTGPWYSIIGVVGSVRGATLDAEPEAYIYYPMVPVAGDTTNDVPHAMSVVLRTAGDPASASGAARAEVRALDPGLPVYNVRPMAAVLRSATARTTFTLTLLGVASAIALALGAVGIYGVISYIVSLRSREIGVRIALGAPLDAVRWMVTRQGLALAGIGVAVGSIGALALTRLLRSLLFGIAPGDPIAMVAAALLLLIVAAIATAVPAWRASRVDPICVLRGE